MKQSILFIISSLVLLANNVRAEEPSWLTPAFYSYEGREREVSFKGTYRSEMSSLSELNALTEDQKKLFFRNNIDPTLKFIFGPLTNRKMGGPQRGSFAKIDWSSAAEVEGKVMLKYEYSGVWIVDKDLPEQFQIPVPFNKHELTTSRWKSCTDSAPEHQTEWFYWYFWDPTRPGCDHKEGVQYQMVNVQLGQQTTNQTASYPEYNKLFKSTGQDNRLQLTFAFGYVEDVANPNPERDGDEGVSEYRTFVTTVRQRMARGFKESPIYQREYKGSSQPEKIIGRRFQGKQRGVDVVINVVVAAGIDQMELFAKSFAHDHDAFFGWFGHSRVGSGFDAESFWQRVVRSPDYYSVTPNYQIVYWGGCNSYSYYTLPFFEFKAHVANGADPNGTKGLDLIANGLPSFFFLNSDNATIVLDHLLRWEEKPSYQSIVDELEKRAQQSGIDVLVAVLGDEDNDPN